jgi:S-DNA-T family DNA segregation ATPase FtsK/SpoIIIE
LTNESINSVNTLFKFLKIDAAVKSSRKENSFVIFDVVLGPTGTFKKIERLSTEIALSLKSFSVPLIYPVIKDGIIRIQMLETELKDVSFKEVIKEVKLGDYRVPIAIGKKPDDTVLALDLFDLPHLLVAGTTGSGKSTLLHAIINNVLIGKQNIKLALIDPKRIEFSCYGKTNRLFAPIAKDVPAALKLLDELIVEMEQRFVFLEKNNFRNIFECNGALGHIIVIIDELADLMMASNKVAQDKICRLAQKARACGIHMIVATQRPSSEVVTGIIKANFPIRISCQVGSALDSRVILDRNGAEKLTGKGDAIIDGGKYKFERFKAAYISQEEITANVNKNISLWGKIWNS